MTAMFSNNDYVPYSAEKRRKMDITKTNNWSPTNVLWVHRDALELPFPTMNKS
jgi:hypothetical protein